MRSRRVGPASAVAIALVVLPVLFFYSPLPAAIAQIVIDRSELVIESCEVRQPTAASALLRCKATTRVPWMPLRVVSDEATARISLRGGSVLGELTTPALDFGHGGSISALRHRTLHCQEHTTPPHVVL